MPFDLDQWRGEVHQIVTAFARDPQSALQRHGVTSVYGFLLGSTISPVIAAAATDPGNAIVALSSVVGSMGANLVAHIVQQKYDPATVIAVTAEEVQQRDLAPAYEAIARAMAVIPLAEQALEQAGQTVMLDQLRAELQQLGTTGQFAGAIVNVQPSGGITFGSGTRVGQMGDVVAGDSIGGNKVSGDAISGDLYQGNVSVSGGRIYGPVVGHNLGKIIYGRDPAEDERRQLIWYLDTLAAKLNQLPLQGLATKLDERGEGVALSSVYVMLATTSRVLLARISPDEASTYFRDFPTKPRVEYDPDWALPVQAIIAMSLLEANSDARRLYRSLLATEAVQQHQRLVLLGQAGSGKSTFLRHLAWMLTQRELGYAVDTGALPEGVNPTLPIFLSLRRLAGRLATHGTEPTTVFAALQAEIERHNVADVGNVLREALHSGTALLLFDGLDEVPVEGEPGVRTNRFTTAQAVRAFANLYRTTPIVLTCRVRAFSDELCQMLGWHVETLAPFTLGQVRHFVPAWYAELVQKGHLEYERTAPLTETLIQALVERPRLREMAETPLLLTMMASVLYTRNELPRDRPQLYETILGLLLGEWDRVRDGQSLAEAIGEPDWDSARIRPVLDQLAYAAHLHSSSEDGRGRLTRPAIEAGLRAHFEEAGMRRDKAAGAAVRCLDYIEQRSGLLLPDENDSFAFAHLTLQEHCAGRHMVLGSEDPVALVLQHRVDDRWREPIFLGLGLAPPADLDDVLDALLDRREDERDKPIDCWYRDLILAAELGVDRDWSRLRTLPRIKVKRHHEILKRGLVTLLDDHEQPLPTAERVRAGFLLGDLGDPRFPVAIEEWKATRHAWSEPDAVHSAPVNESHASQDTYWCHVQSGAYRIGGWQKNQPDVIIELSNFWIARFPVTVAQFAPFVGCGYSDAAQRWWTPSGWRWKRDEQCDHPAHWHESAYMKANQPVIGVSWYETAAFAAWLTEQLSDVLPEGYVVRLPTEAEWEAAAAYDTSMQRHSYPWGEDAPTPERAIYGRPSHDAPAPVGCCPSGAASCGALDMAGNAGEWISSSFTAYPEQSHVALADIAPDIWDVTARGGAYWSDNTALRCGAQSRLHPDMDSAGFRLVVASRLTQDNLMH